MTDRLIALGVALSASLVLLAGPSNPWAYSANSFAAALSLQETMTDEWLGLDGVVGTAIGFDGHLGEPERLAERP